MVDTAKIWSAYAQIVDLELLEDRREYTAEDLAKGFDLTESEGKELHELVQGQFDPDVMPLDKIPTDTVKNYLLDTTHNGMDGWEAHHRTTIELLLIDLGRYAKAGG